MDLDAVNTEDNMYIRSDTGAVAAPSSSTGHWVYTDYTPITPGVAYYFDFKISTASMAGLAWYDSDQKYLSGVGSRDLRNAGKIAVSPENAAYLRWSFRIDDMYNHDWRYTTSIRAATPDEIAAASSAVSEVTEEV